MTAFNDLNQFSIMIGCVSKPLYPGHISDIMPRGGGGGGGGANVQLNAYPRRIKKFKTNYVGVKPVS